ncbi:MAG: hypothetical protein IAF94_01060 [Pirellulaceae bacterium]|nr:hypothetical protein [Pirellulaceae bacterium]
MQDHRNQQESSRQRALRIPLDYHRTRGPLGTWKLILTLASFAAGGIYLAWALAGGTPAISQLSPGVLAKDHACWDSDCKACHVPFVPQRGDANGIRALGLSLATDRAKNPHDETDAKCSKCHKSAGAHHANQLPAEIESCASCHRDHGGRDFDMTRMDDAHCTSCHAAIGEHRVPQPSKWSPAIADVRMFEAAGAGSGHPPFRSLNPPDPGKLRFSHRLHLTEGQIYPGQLQRKELLSKQLVCSDCHQPDVATGGAYMQPINYQQHCQKCHPLNLPDQPTKVVPHGLKTAAELEIAVRELLTASVPPPEQPAPRRVIPGKSKLEPDPGRQVPSDLVLQQRLTQLRKSKCSQCHSWKPESPGDVQLPGIPVPWLKHARFDHQKHQAPTAKCEDCHANANPKTSMGDAYDSGVYDKHESNQILIPNIGKCVECHAPHDPSIGPKAGTARFDCAECHRYHPKVETSAKPAKEPAKPLRPSSSKPVTTHWPEPLRLTLIAHQQPEEASPTPLAHPYVGTRSCSATGCHGAASKSPGSSSAYTRFTAVDPHEGAFLLLYSDASRRMLERLPKLKEPGYFAALKKNCIGCHATPPADLAKSNQSDSYLSGVSCESCHGAAVSWEYTHFKPKTTAGGSSRELPNLENLEQRAKICAECHIGPMKTPDHTYDVNHDLIAAGHPRLTFEFEAQSANLPAHWSPQKDIQEHFAAWKAGELATAAQQEKLYAEKDRGEFEFASHRCYDCHHAMSEKPAAGRVKFAKWSTLEPEERALLARPATTRKEQIDILLGLRGGRIDISDSSAGTRWEERVHFSLALAAFLDDGSANQKLKQDATSLHDILTKSFRSLPADHKLKKDATFRGGPYDSPNAFRLDEEQVQQLLEKIHATLRTP